MWFKINDMFLACFNNGVMLLLYSGFMRMMRGKPIRLLEFQSVIFRSHALAPLINNNPEHPSGSLTPFTYTVMAIAFGAAEREELVAK